jgi:MATE family multidrug resistance protein
MIRYFQLHQLKLKKLLQLSIPLIAGQLGLVFMGFFDNLMVGKLGHIPLAAVGIANSVFFLVSILGIGILLVISTLVAMRLGNGQEEQIPSLLRSGMFISLLLTVLLGAVLFYISYHFELMHQPEEVAAIAGPYMRLLALSQLPMYMYMAAKGITDGYELTRVSMAATLSALLLNIFLNWLFIFGNWGFPRLELVGAGVATLLSRIYMAVFVLFFIWKSARVPVTGRQIFRYRRSLDLLQMKEILRLGVPSGFQYFFEVAAFAVAAVMAGWIGAKSLAAHQAAITLASVTYMFATGISAGASILVGAEFGKNDLKAAGHYGKLAQLVILSCMLIFGLLFVLFSESLVGLFVFDPVVTDMAISLMLLAAAFQIFDGVQAVNLGILRGLEDVNVPLWITLSAYWVIAIPLGYWLGISMDYGIFGIWIGLTSGLVITATSLSIRFYNRLRKQ